MVLVKSTVLKIVIRNVIEDRVRVV